MLNFGDDMSSKMALKGFHKSVKFWIMRFEGMIEFSEIWFTIVSENLKLLRFTKCWDWTIWFVDDASSSKLKKCRRTQKPYCLHDYIVYMTSRWTILFSGWKTILFDAWSIWFNESKWHKRGLRPLETVQGVTGGQRALDPVLCAPLGAVLTEVLWHLSGEAFIRLFTDCAQAHILPNLNT